MKYGILLASIAVMASQGAWAGHGEGNGGGGFICPDQGQSEMLDLFEAQFPGLLSENGLTIPPSSATVEDQIAAVFKKVGPGSVLYAPLLSTYQRVRTAKVVHVPQGAIAWPRDAVNGFTKPGCSPTGLILFNDAENRMFEDEQSIDALPAQQQAALWVHETVYKYLRETSHDPDSVRARKVVGYLFSDLPRDSVGAALKTLGLDGDVWTNQPIYQPRECPTGTKSAEINFMTLANQPNDFIIRGRVFDRRDTTRKHPLAQVDLFKGWASQVCLPLGNYVYSFKPIGAQLRTAQLWVMRGDALNYNSFGAIDAEECKVDHLNFSECTSFDNSLSLTIGD